MNIMLCHMSCRMCRVRQHGEDLITIACGWKRSEAMLI